MQLIPFNLNITCPINQHDFNMTLEAAKDVDTLICSIL